MNMMNLKQLVKKCAVGLVMGLALLAGSARGSTTIASGSTFTINDSNSTKVGIVWTWNDTGTLMMSNGAILQTWPTQPSNQDVINNDAIVFAGTSGTITFRFNGNDTDHKLNGSSITSTATGAQTLAILTGYNGNGDRESVTFNSGIPNAGNGSAMGLDVTFRCQTGSQSRVNLPAINTFTGPINLVAGGGPATGYLTIGGTLTRNNGNTIGTGKLGNGTYPGAIALGANTILNYASTAAQTLAGVISGTGLVQVTGSGPLTLSAVNTYATTTTVNSGCTLILADTGGMKFVLTDTTTNKITGGGTATLNGTFTLDTSAVTKTSGTWTLVDASTKTFGSSFGLTGFDPPVGDLYTKSAGGQTWTFDKSNGVLSLSSQALITAFGIPGYAGVINQANKTIALTVLYSTVLADLAPTYTLTSGSCDQTSGAPPSPTFADANPVTYTVTDGSVVNPYVVTVTKAVASTACDITACNFPGLGYATISGTNIALVVPPNQSLNPLAPEFTLSPGATISPESGIGMDFTTDQIYIVTAESGATKSYTVSVLTYQNWTYNGSLYILTTPDGANIPAGATETNFPLLVRLNAGNFDFSQAQPNGSDIRFAIMTGEELTALSYQIEQWDQVAKTAAIWVKIPTITGDSSQEIKMYWGRTGVGSESNGANVFNAANGFLSVWHMTDPVRDEVGTLESNDLGTAATAGMVGSARHFPGQKGVSCGENIQNYPNGASPHSTEVWYRADASNMDLVCWGIEGTPAGKVRMQLQSPPHIYVDSDGGSIHAMSALPKSEWVQVVHTYDGRQGQIYVNGQLDVPAPTQTTMKILPTARMWLGGWYNGYNFIGDMDEVRISKVARSADWVRMQYENQKPLQTLVGNLVKVDGAFAVTPPSLTINEGSSDSLSGEAGGAQKVYWIEQKNGMDTIVATDQFTLNVAAGRVTGDQSYVIQYKGIYAAGNQVVDIPVTIMEYLPDPEFTLTGPSTWDGRQTITLTPDISNLSALQAKNVANLTYAWTVNGVAVTKTLTPGTTTVPGVMTLTRSQGSGPMTVTLTLDNGGSRVSATKTISVQEPASDAWVQRTPGATEKVVNNQFIARDPNTNKGMIYYNGTGAGTAPVYLKVYTTDTGSNVAYGTPLRQTPQGGVYAFSFPIDAGKVTYKVEFGTTTSGGIDNPPSATVTNLVCGDAYIIDGQSNALATDNAAPNDSTTDPWIRTYGLTVGWGYGISKGTEMQLGLWGWYLAKSMTSTLNMPVCFIQGAVGGTRIDQHQPNPDGHGVAGSSYSIYANIYKRVTGGNLTHGIRGVFWHQGESNSGAAAPTGDYDYKSYQQYFVDMSAAWKQDFPNIQRYIIYQVMPKPCSMGPKGDQIREVLRTLPFMYSNMNILGTLGMAGYEGCHFNSTGYQNFANLTAPLVGQDFYGIVPADVVTSPNLLRAWFTTSSRTQIALEFDQNMSWNPNASVNFYLDKVGGKVSSGEVDSVNRKIIKLQLSSAAAATATLDYLEDDHWSFNESVSSLIYGANTLSALSFADVPLSLAAPSGLVATAGAGEVVLTWSAVGGADGYKVKRALTSGGPYADLDTTVSTGYTDTTVINGTTYYYVVAATLGADVSVDSTEASATPGSYASWVESMGLAGSPGDADPDHDGIDNALEFVLGGDPKSGANSDALLPRVTQNARDLVCTFERKRNSTGAVNLNFQWSTNLDFPAVNDVAVLGESSITNGVTVDITENNPDNATDTILITVPAAKATGGGKLFGRLRAIVP
jgi:autotransporter-associated beta strand protein